MKLTVVLGADGSIRVLTREGTLESGKPIILGVLAGLADAGIALQDVGEVEQHTHADQHSHVHQNV